MLKGLPGALRRCGNDGYHLVRTSREWASVYAVEGPHGGTIRVLDVGGAYQSATYLGKRRFEPVFSYYRTFDAVFAGARPVRRALMIGGGGCAWPKHAAATRPGIRIDVVEEDPRIIDIARRFFFVGELEAGRGEACRGEGGPRATAGGGFRAAAESGRGSESSHGTIRLVAAEGRSYLDRCTIRYDAVLNDAFRGEDPAESLATVEAARAVARILEPGGVYAANVVSRCGGADLSFLRDAVATLSEAFPNVQVIPCPDTGYSEEDNYLVVATDAETRFSGALPYDEGFPRSVLRDR